MSMRVHTINYYFIVITFKRNDRHLLFRMLKIIQINTSDHLIGRFRGKVKLVEYISCIFMTSYFTKKIVKRAPGDSDEWYQWRLLCLYT